MVTNGLFYDLFDSNGLYGVYERNITDNVSGISYSTLYSNLGGSTDNLSDYKNRLKNTFSANSSAIEELFNQYGF